MGFFDKLYYGKAGKRDYSEMDMPKTRVGLFFQSLKDHVFDLVKVNLLQLPFWIPFLVWSYINLAAVQSIDIDTLMTAENGSSAVMNAMLSYLIMWLIGLIPCIAITGPSSAASAYIMRNWARDEHAFLWSDYKDALKGNWKQALGVSVITSFMPLIVYTAVAYYGQLASSNLLMMLPLVVVLSASLMWTLMIPLLYPLMVGYELTFKHLIKNALLIAAARLPQMVLARLITLIPIAALVIGLYIGNAWVLVIVALYYMLYGFSLSRLIYASFANGAFDRYLNPHIEGAKVNQGLRPHTEFDEILEEIDEEDDELGDEADDD